MDRKALIRHPFTKESKLIEIGASYNPIIPKADGWRTTIIDHADQATLREKYRGETFENIEPVDYVWTDGPIDQLIPTAEHGTFDGLIASHVGEHLPDPIGFLLAMDRLLAPHAVIALALPDLRTCFDFFRPRSTTGDLLDARGRVRHRPGKIFDNHALMTNRNGVGGWAYGLSLEQGGDFKLVSDLSAAYHHMASAGERQSDPYMDAHGWCFTPASFHLSMLELFTLNVIPWSVSRLDPSGGIEFYVWLERRRLKLPNAELETLRLKLLRDMIEEADEQLLQIRQRPVLPPASRSVTTGTPTLALAAPDLTVTAIVPMYNGAHFIERALSSILAQTIRPKELFVIDDGSTDTGADVVNAFIASHDLNGIDFHLLRTANGGQSAARNLGVKQASGDLIGLLDQDDEWYPMHIERLREPFFDPPPGLPLGWVYSNLDRANGDGQLMFRNWLPGVHPKTDLFSCLACDMYILPSAALIRRDAFNAVGGFDVTLSGYEDDDLFRRMFRHYSHVFVNEPLSKWCIHPNSSSYTSRMRISRIRYCEKLLAEFADDSAQTIYYARDVILPRFYPQAVVELRNALLAGDPQAINETHQVMQTLVRHAAQRHGIHGLMSPRKAHRLNRMLRVVTPTRAPYVFAMRSLVRPITRRTLFR